MIDPKSAIGKPFVVFADGEKRQIGTITHAAVKNGSLYVGAKLDLSEPEPEPLPIAPENNTG